MAAPTYDNWTANRKKICSQPFNCLFAIWDLIAKNHSQSEMRFAKYKPMIRDRNESLLECCLFRFLSTITSIVFGYTIAMYVKKTHFPLGLPKHEENLIIKLQTLLIYNSYS